MAGGADMKGAAGLMRAAAIALGVVREYINGWMDDIICLISFYHIISARHSFCFDFNSIFSQGLFSGVVAKFLIYVSSFCMYKQLYLNVQFYFYIIYLHLTTDFHYRIPKREEWPNIWDLITSGSLLVQNKLI